jgi:hypothetical protein
MRHFFGSVAGESFRNDDGTDRQAIIAGIRAGEPLELIAEPDNPHDENAIKVLREDGKQIGYVKRSLAARLVDDLSDFRAFVAGIGRGRDGRYLGVSLLIVVHDSEDDAAVDAYARRVLAEDREVPDRPFRRRSRQSTGSRANMSHTDRSIALVVIIIIAVAVVVAIALLR